MDEPANTRAVRDRIRNITGVKQDGSPVNRRRRMEVANTVVGQLLPAGAVKGGAAMAFRLGSASRFSLDFDATQGADPSEFLAAFEQRLGEGWGGFTGTISTRPPATPEGIPVQYVMQPFGIRLLYKGSTWAETIDFELSADELGSTTEPEMHISDDTLSLFEQIGLPRPSPVPLIPVVHQVAQKIHACTSPGSERAHDLIDLQLLFAGDIDLTLLAETTRRLFAYRKAHAWPARVEPTASWSGLYTAALGEVDPAGPLGAQLAPTVDDAVARINKLLDRLNQDPD